MASPSAFAHAQLASSDPRNGARLDESPDSVSLTFTEPPEESLSRMHVLDSSGGSWEQSEPSVVEGNEYTLRVQVRDLDEGVYTVTWRTVSKVDGHATSGVVAFGVGVDPAEAAAPVASAGDDATDTSASVVELTGRWLLLVGLVSLFGAATIGAAVLRRWAGAVRRLGEGAAVASGAGLVLLAEGQRRVAQVPIGDFLATSIGAAIVWRAAALGVAAGGLIAARRSRSAGLLACALGALAAMLVHVYAGHAAAGQSWSWANVAAQWMHFAAAGVWVGGLAALLAGTRGAAGADKAAAVKRFSTAAAIMLVVVAASGLFRAVNEVDGWGSLLSTGYGRVVMVKVGLLGGLAVLGAINRYRSVPAATRSLSPLRRISRMELGVAAAALLAAAVLAGLSPSSPREATVPRTTEGIAVTGSDFATSVRARLEVTPGRAGLNAFTLELADYDTGEPVRADRVSLGFMFAEDSGVARSELELKAAGPDEYRAEGPNLSLSGRWEVTVVVERGPESVEVPIELATRCDARNESVPGRRAVWAIELSHGLSAESWVDPGTAGHNDIHLTFFDADHEEFEIDKRPKVRATTGDGDEAAVPIRRLGPGHFVGTAHLEEGHWRFELAATAHGQKMQACFEETIGPAS
jgi:copper transport protein